MRARARAFFFAAPRVWMLVVVVVVEILVITLRGSDNARLVLVYSVGNARIEREKEKPREFGKEGVFLSAWTDYNFRLHTGGCKARFHRFFLVLRTSTGFRAIHSMHAS